MSDERLCLNENVWAVYERHDSDDHRRERANTLWRSGCVE